MNRTNVRPYVAWTLAIVMCLTTAVGAWSAPVPPLLVVNHTTRQCGEIFGGDECMDCLPEEGWEVVGLTIDEGVQCPDGYTWADPSYTCRAFRSEFCCTEYHSGAPGECQDLVINRRQSSCAFLDSEVECTLPRGWQARPQGDDSSNWLCPSDFTWTQQPSCVSDGSGSGLLAPLLLVALLGIVVILIASIVVLALVLRRART